MGYLKQGGGLLAKVIDVGGDLTGVGLVRKEMRRKEAGRNARLMAETQRMEAQARKQQLDLVSEAQAAAAAQVEAQARAAADSKRQAIAAQNPGEVNVALTDASTTESASAATARRRKQFFNDGGYSPGVKV